MKKIREKSLYFLFSLSFICKDDTSKEKNMYEISKKLEYGKTDTEYIVEYLSSIDLIQYKKTSNKVSIIPKGVEIIKSERSIEYLLNVEGP